MATLRGNRYYLDRRFAGVGRIHRSLRTSRATRARTLESMLEKLHERGQVVLLRAFAKGELSIYEIEEAYDRGGVPEVSLALERKQDESNRVAVESAIEEAMEAIAADVRLSTPAQIPTRASPLQGVRGSIHLRGGSTHG